jgi:hypothetical protein
MVEGMDSNGNSRTHLQKTFFAFLVVSVAFVPLFCAKGAHMGQKKLLLI